MPNTLAKSLALALGLLATACTSFHLPQLYLRGSLTPAATLIASDGSTTRGGDVMAFDVGLVGHLGDVELPAAEEPTPEAPAPSSLLGPSAPCRIATACAWERRAVAEARARVIGGAP